MPEFQAATTASVLLGRMVQPGEIARASVFLASESAGFVTDQTLHVNGGFLSGVRRRVALEAPGVSRNFVLRFG